MPDGSTSAPGLVLWLVRHGQTDWNVEGRYQGQADPPLNAIGQAEAQRAAQKLAGQPLRAIYSSDLQRAQQTAAIISRASGLPVQLDARLREVSLGAWEGMLFDQIRVQYPEGLLERERNPLNARPPGGETVEEVWQRARAAVRAIAARHPGEQVVLVSHGLTLGTLIAYAKDRDPAQAFRYIPPNGVVQCLEWQ